MSAPEAEEAESAALVHVQPWLEEAVALSPTRRGRQRRPSIIGLGSSAKQLTSLLYRPVPKKAAATPKVKASVPAGGGQTDPMLQQILNAVTEIGTRVSTLEQQQQQQQQRPQQPSQSAA
eukprot:6057914-Amphidinium_carterae.1